MNYLTALGAACSFSLSGNVVDRHDHSALSYATIYIAELQSGTTADSNGHFEFNNLCAGKYTIILDHINCPTDTVFVTINNSLHQEFYLEHHSEELAEIVATANKVQNTSTQTSVTIDKKALEKMEGKDLGGILSTVSGVNQLKTGTTISKPIIHGLYGNRISIINNGVKLETQDWGAEHAPEIDPFSSGTIRVIKGVGSLEYGTDAMGGMVILDPPLLRKQKHIKENISVIGQTNGHGITTSANFEQGFQKQVAYFIQGTFKRLGDQQTPHYNLSNTGLQEANLSTGFGFLKKGWELNSYYSLFDQQLGILKSSHIGNLTDLENAIARDTPLIVQPFTYSIENPKQKIAHHLAKVNLKKFLLHDNYFELIYALQVNRRKEYDIRRGGRSNIPALDMRLLSHDLTANFKRTKSWKEKYNLEGKSGFNLLTKHNANNPQTGIRPLIPDYYQYELGLYDMEKLSLNDFGVEAGLRYDYTRFLVYKFDRNNVLLKPKYNFHTYALSVGGTWRSKSSIVLLQSHFSLSSRFPNASELFSDGLHHGIAALEFGNADLKPESGIKWINTLNCNYKTFIHAEISFYTSKIYHFIYLAPLPDPVLTIRGAFPAFQYYQTNARLTGLDISVSSDPISFLTLSLRSSLVRGKNTSANDYLIYMPSDNIYAGIELHHDFRLLHNVHFGLTTEHVFRQSRTPSQIIDYKPAPPAYTLLNAEAGFDWQVNTKNRLSFSVSAENMTNATYRDYLNRFRYYSDELGWNLTFRLKYAFAEP